MSVLSYLFFHICSFISVLSFLFFHFCSFVLFFHFSLISLLSLFHFSFIPFSFFFYSFRFFPVLAFHFSFHRQINIYQLKTANDAPERDPTAWRILVGEKKHSNGRKTVSKTIEDSSEWVKIVEDKVKNPPFERFALYPVKWLPEHDD
jgi:hypothetical protein